MPSIVFHCPNCGQKIKAPDTMVGSTADCPNCRTAIAVPDQSESITFYCPNCGQKIRASSEMAGRSAECPNCHVETAIPGESMPKPGTGAPSPSAGRPAGPGPGPEPGWDPAPARPPITVSRKKGPVVVQKARAPEPDVAQQEKPSSEPAPAKKPTIEQAERKDPVNAPDKARVTPSQPRPGLAGNRAARVRIEKPAGLAFVAALLSVIPGFGQAYNLNIGKAYVFGGLFVVGLAGAVFKPDLGLSLLAVIMFLAMSDAYGSSLGKGFFGGLGRGILALCRGYFGVVGLTLWSIVAILAADSIACRVGTGNTIVSTVDLASAPLTGSTVMTGYTTGSAGDANDTSTGTDGSGTVGAATAPRETNNWLVLAIVVGAGLLLFFLLGFGRKFLWARGRRAHFSHVIRMFLAAAFLAGLFAATVRLFQPEQGKAFAGAVLNLPLGMLKGILSLPETVGRALGKTWPAFVPGFYAPASTAVREFGASAAGSFMEHASVYNVLLLAGAVGFLVSCLGCMVRASRNIPPYDEIIEEWLVSMRRNADIAREQWAQFREARAAAWQVRREQMQAVRLLGRIEDNRIARLETMVDRIAGHLGLEPLPPSEEESGELQAAKLRGAGLARCAGLKMRHVCRVAGTWIWTNLVLAGRKAIPLAGKIFKFGKTQVLRFGRKHESGPGGDTDPGADTAVSNTDNKSAGKDREKPAAKPENKPPVPKPKEHNPKLEIESQPVAKPEVRPKPIPVRQPASEQVAVKPEVRPKPIPVAGPPAAKPGGQTPVIKIG